MLKSEVARTYCVIPILDNLVDVKKFRDFCESKNIEFSSFIVRGYSFSVVCTISYLIKRVMEAPNTFGLDFDRLLQRADFVGLPFCRLPDKSISGKFARNLVELYHPFLGIDRWEKFNAAGSRISEFIIQTCKIAFEKGLKNACENQNDKEFVDSVLKYASIWFWDYILLDFSDVRSTYRNAYKKGNMSLMSNAVPLVIDKRHNFFEGYKYSIEYLLESLVICNQNKIKVQGRLKKVDDWKSFNRLFPNVRTDQLILGQFDFEKSNYLDSIFKSDCIGNSFSALTQSQHYIKRPKTVDESLDELFMWYEVTMLDGGNNYLGFITMLKGYASFDVDNIQIIKLAHPQQGVDGNNYSFAILIESSGFISDSSYWVLFYDFATDYSGTGGSYYNHVLEELKNLSEKVNLIEASVDEEILLKYLEGHRVRRLVTQGQELLRLSDSLKGGLFELFIAHLLSRMQFTSYVRYRNSEILGKKEIDIISAKISEGKINMVIVEAFGSFPNNTSQISTEMKEKLLAVKNNYAKVLSDIGFKFDSKKAPLIQGWVVTYDSTHVRRLAPNIFVYDINKVNELCNNFGVNYNAFSGFMKKERHFFDF